VVSLAQTRLDRIFIDIYKFFDKILILMTLPRDSLKVFKVYDDCQMLEKRKSSAINHRLNDISVWKRYTN